MRLINYLYFNFFKALLISICTSYSIFFIFSLFGNFEEKLNFLSIIYLSALNSIQVFAYMPSYIIVFSLFLMINSFKTKNELIIIKEYLNIEKIIIIFIPIIIFFTFLEINKDHAISKIEELKINYSNINNLRELKVLKNSSESNQTYIVIKNIDFISMQVKEYLNFKLKNNLIVKGEFSNDLSVKNNEIIKKSSIVYENEDINSISSNEIIFKDFNFLKSGKTFEITKDLKNKKLFDLSVLCFLIFFFLLYLCILMSFFSKKILNKNNSTMRLISFVTLLLLYSLIITRIDVSIFNSLFQVISIFIMTLIFFNIKKYE